MTPSLRSVCAIVVAALALSGCSIQQSVEPVVAQERAGAEICVVEDKQVREGFLVAYTRALQGKGLVVKVVPSIAEARACPMYSTYVGNWRWDLALYLAYAKITVFRGDEKIGEALYDSLVGGGRLDKFIDAEAKINELVGQLFPD